MRRVFLVDDHELFRAGVRGELSDVVDVVGEAGSVAEAVPLIRELDPEVVLLDVHLPGGGGPVIGRVVRCGEGMLGVVFRQDGATADRVGRAVAALDRHSTAA